MRRATALFAPSSLLAVILMDRCRVSQVALAVAAPTALYAFSQQSSMPIARVHRLPQVALAVFSCTGRGRSIFGDAPGEAAIADEASRSGGPRIRASVSITEPYSACPPLRTVRSRPQVPHHGMPFALAFA